MNITENYIGYDALVSYLIEVSYSIESIESNNYIYYEFLTLDLNEWQNFNFTWYNRFLKAAKNLFEPDIFIAVKKKIQEEHFCNLKVIKECDKKNLILAEIFQPDTLLSKKTSKDFIKNLSETLQPDLQVIKEYKKENLVFTETSQPDVLQPDVLLSKKTVKIPIENHFEFTDFCYDILHELENKSYAKSYANKSYKHINLKLKNNQYTSLEEFEKDIRLIFCNCYIYNNVESEVISLGKALECIFNKKWDKNHIIQNRQTEELKRKMMIQQIRELKREIRNQILEQNKNNFNRCFVKKKRCYMLRMNNFKRILPFKQKFYLTMQHNITLSC
ncbi:bromodomain-containing protein [Rhizophagus irregularis DAOM 181602=DAOM 197198]|nr:bromodomain-containing protein [Rhizophagus irregularis DAOM 181602=DAOM 197198]